MINNPKNLSMGGAKSQKDNLDVQVDSWKKDPARQWASGRSKHFFVVFVVFENVGNQKNAEKNTVLGFGFYKKLRIYWIESFCWSPKP